LALSAKIFRFQVELSDIDRGVYESLDLRVAKHPSEDEERVVVRVLARALAHETGLEFGRGLSNVEEPALWTHTATGEVCTWIDVGAPSAARLHRASKAADRVLVFTHKPTATLSREWSARAIHRAREVIVVRLGELFIRELAERLGRTVTWFVIIQDGRIGVSVDGQEVACDVVQTTLHDFLDGAS
jgi:uncharacterized protein YaeQ